MDKILYVYDSLVVKKKMLSTMESIDLKITPSKFSIHSFKDIDSINKHDVLIIDISVNLIELFIEDIKSIHKPIIVILKEYNEQLLMLLKNIRSCEIKMSPVHMNDIRSTLFIFKTEQVAEQHVDKSQMPQQLINVLAYIDENITKRHNINDLALLTKWQYVHFIRVFKKHLHLTPHQYILKRKVLYAKNILEKNEVNLTELSKICGFISYSNFYNAFVKETNQTPFNFKYKNFESKLERQKK
ncbi:MAG: helix-turn-helix transcriptional regulator [Crocinitomicaceae bacterium]|nr:helix-turn-helix transcriptional regulator [Crocinitomicaceae bacterium]